MNEKYVFPSLRITEYGARLSVGLNSTPYTHDYAGCKLHYWLAGPQDAPLVVLTHGEGADHHTFDSQVQLLARSWRVLTWDIRGHGLSHSDRPFSLEQAVDDLHTILEQEGLDAAIFAGISAGGQISQLFAQRYPASVHGVALLSCLPLSGPDSSLDRFWDSLTSGLLHLLPYWFIRAQIPAYVSVRPEVQSYAAEAMKVSGKEQFMAAWQSTFHATVAERPFKLCTPLLVAFGAYDRHGWINRAKNLWAEGFPHAQIVTVPGASHCLTQDNPSFTTQMLIDFVSQCLRERRQAAQPSL